MRSDAEWERVNVVAIWLIVLIILSMLASMAYCKYRSPRIVKDYKTFAIVEMEGSRFVWIRDVYGEGVYYVDYEEKEIQRE